MYVKMEGIELYIRDDKDPEVVKMYYKFLKKYIRYLKKKPAEIPLPPKGGSSLSATMI